MVIANDWGGNQIPAALHQAFRDTGTSQSIAISGFNMPSIEKGERISPKRSVLLFRSNVSIYQLFKTRLRYTGKP